VKKIIAVLLLGILTLGTAIGCSGDKEKKSSTTPAATSK